MKSNNFLSVIQSEAKIIIPANSDLNLLIRSIKEDIMDRIFVLAFIFIFFTSCDKERKEGMVIDDPEFAMALQSKSHDSLKYHENNYIIQAELWRDFFPSIKFRKKHPLNISIYLVNTDSLMVSTDLYSKRVYLIKNNQIWIADLENGNNSSLPDYKLQVQNSNGPEWDTNSLVDVILEISNKKTQELYYLIKRQQKILRTD